MNDHALKIGLTSITGRVAKLIARALIDAPDISALSGAYIRREHDQQNDDIGTIVGTKPVGLTPSTDLEHIFRNADVIIDFTLPDALKNHLDMAVRTSTPLVIGTTGLTGDQEDMIQNASLDIPVVYAPNTSLGVTVLTALVEKAASLLNTEWDIEISETHHKKKVDAPSGTAITLGEAAAKGRNKNLNDVADYARHGNTGERKEGNIGFSVLRGGDVPGEHTVSFFGPAERIEITHRAHDRKLFANGAIRAAKWAYDQKPGLYSMKDVLGLK